MRARYARAAKEEAVDLAVVVRADPRDPERVAALTERCEADTRALVADMTRRSGDGVLVGFTARAMTERIREDRRASAYQRLPVSGEAEAEAEAVYDTVLRRRPGGHEAARAAADEARGRTAQYLLERNLGQLQVLRVQVAGRPGRRAEERRASVPAAGLAVTVAGRTGWGLAAATASPGEHRLVRTWSCPVPPDEDVTEVGRLAPDPPPVSSDSQIGPFTHSGCRGSLEGDVPIYASASAWDILLVRTLSRSCGMSIKQRLLAVLLIALIVIGLIFAGASPELALTITSGIVLIAREVWTLGQPTSAPEESDSVDESHPPG